MRLLAPAKINWFLKVGPKGPDGYHQIVSLMQTITLYDEITIEESDGLTLECDIPFKENIALKAAMRLKEITGSKRGAHIRIKKEIPAGAGLGGGSSDAATVLMGLNEFWGTGLSRDQLTDIAIEIGSDVPFFLHAPSALVIGRGERIKRWDFPVEAPILLVKPEVSISTAWAYSELDRLREEKDEEGEFLLNDLEGPVFMKYPELREIKERLKNSGAIHAAMTGSGSALFGVFREAESARKAQQEFPKLWTRVVKTIVRSSSQ